MSLAKVLVWFSLVTLPVFSGLVPEGGPCSLANNRIDSASHKFTSDCDDRTFCSVSDNSTSQRRDVSPTATAPLNMVGTCIKRLCRKDEYPFGYAAGETLPPLCGHNFYCPDEGSGCQPLLPVASPCQMDRDYQCAPWNNPSDDGPGLVSSLNFNGSVCLQSVCQYANVTLGLPCILERTSYSGLDHNYVPYNITIARDNCRTSSPRLYCGPASALCEKMKPLGEACSDDRECLSQNCNTSNMCVEPFGLPAKVGSWQYALTTISVLGAVTTICWFLTLGHKRRRIQRYYEVLEYFHEQMSLRNSIISLHAAAAQRLSEGEKLY